MSGPQNITRNIIFHYYVKQLKQPLLVYSNQRIEKQQQTESVTGLLVFIFVFFKDVFRAEWDFFPQCKHNCILILLLVCPRHEVTSSHSLCPLCAGNAAVVKPSELSEFSSLLLRTLLPRYLDQVWTLAAIVSDCFAIKAFCSEWRIENRTACFTAMILCYLQL